jgi:hypothetical protein
VREAHELVARFAFCSALEFSAAPSSVELVLAGIYAVTFAELPHGEDKEDYGLVIVANPVMIEAYQARHSCQRQAVPRRPKMAKIHWNPKKLETFPAATVPGTQHDVDFMVKDSKRFADSGGWG